MTVKQKAGPEAVGVQSSFEGHPRWLELMSLLGIGPGDNGFLAKSVRDLALVEAEQRAAGSGPDLQGQLRRLRFDVAEAARLVDRHTSMRLPVPEDVGRRLDAAEDAVDDAEAALETREGHLRKLREGVGKAHGAAVRALHAEIRSRLGALAREANAIVNSAGRRPPHRLDDRLYDIEGAVRALASIALAFSPAEVGVLAGEGDFLAALSPGAQEMVEEKLRQPRAPRLARVS